MIYSEKDRHLTELYIAKAAYLAAQNTESIERQEALELAKNTAKTSLERFLAYRAYANYLTDISRYRLSNRYLEICKQILSENPQYSEYLCSVVTLMGVNDFTSFNNHTRAEMLFREAVSFQDQFPGNPDVLRNVSAALHYQARMAELQRRLADALKLYIKSQTYLELSKKETAATAFYHLRVGELLTGAKLFDHARDHLRICQAMFDKILNNASGLVQVELALAGLCAAEGDIPTAQDAVEKSLLVSMNKGYTRGKLLCLGYRLVLHIRAHQLLRIPNDLRQIALTSFAAGGELRRNNLINLIFKLPILVNFLLYRISNKNAISKRIDPTSSQSLITCVCPIHGSSQQ